MPVFVSRVCVWVAQRVCVLSLFISIVFNIASQYGDELLDVKRPGSVDRQTLILINECIRS